MRLLLALILAGLLRPAELQICDPVCASDEHCNTINGNLTCSCNITIYSGTNDRSLRPILTCNPSAMTISVSRCQLEALNRYPELSYLLNTSCTSGYSTVLNGISMHSIQILPQNRSCGNVMQKDDVFVTYWNVLHIPGDASTGILNIPFSCTYTLNMQDSSPDVLFPTGSTIDLAIQNTGSVPTIMTGYLDASYTVPITGIQQEVTVGSTIYLGIVMQFEDIPVYVLRAETCFATPVPDPNSLQKVMLIIGGCPADGGFLSTVEANGLSLEVRFSVAIFSFQGFSELHIYCDVRLCDQTVSQTCTGCTTLRSGDLGEGSGRLRMGPIPLETYDSISSGSRTAVHWAVMCSSLLVLLSLL